jgi:hypothetical protein
MTISTDVIAALKRELKTAQLTYADLAAAMGMAESSVKRMMAKGDTALVLKFDVRNYVCNGQVQLLAARLYQGQTTNFRTPGGGFAPVYVSP